MNQKRITLERIYNRMCFHSGAPIDSLSEKRARFIANLLVYPEDLICAAYLHLQHYIVPYQLPDEADFISFIEPEYRRRQSCQAFDDVRTCSESFQGASENPAFREPHRKCMLTTCEAEAQKSGVSSKPSKDFEQVLMEAMA